MPVWKGIVGRGFTPQDFSSYVASIAFGAWRPQFVVLHNTAVPKLADWHAVPGEARMRNLENYYKNVQQWSAGPHLFVADDLIWVFTPLDTPGVHSPSWNAISWGAEMVGDYSVEDFSPAVRNNVLSALGTLHAAMGIDPKSLRLHKEDPRTTHICPGMKVAKTDIIAGVQQQLALLHPGEHTPGGAANA